jgi:hypothetical protein
MDILYAGTRRCDESLFPFLPPYIPQGGRGRITHTPPHPPDQTSGSKPKLIMQKEYLTTLMGDTLWLFARK